MDPKNINLTFEYFKGILEFGYKINDIHNYSVFAEEKYLKKKLIDSVRDSFEIIYKEHRPYFEGSCLESELADLREKIEKIKANYWNENTPIEFFLFRQKIHTFSILIFNELSALECAKEIIINYEQKHHYRNKFFDKPRTILEIQNRVAKYLLKDNKLKEEYEERTIAIREEEEPLLFKEEKFPLPCDQEEFSSPPDTLEERYIIEDLEKPQESLIASFNELDLEEEWTML